MPIIGITHDTAALERFFSPSDLDRLRAMATIEVLGKIDMNTQCEQLASIDILLGSWGMPKLTAELLTAMPKLTAVCYAAGSVKGFATPESFARGITITTAMSANAQPVIDWTFAIMTLATKNTFLAMERIRSQGTRESFWTTEPPCTGLYDITIGIIGFGVIGRGVVERLRDSAVRIVVYDPFASPVAIAAAGAEAVSLKELAQCSHVVSLHAPDVSATVGMISKDFLAALRDGAIFINTARGRLVDEAALLAELSSGRISAYLDVTKPEPPVADSPFYTLKNCWLTPHRAGSHGNEIRRMGALAIQECLRLIAGQPPRHPVTQAMLDTMA